MTSLKVDGTVQKDGSVKCTVTCDGQQAVLVFTGTDVLLDVPEPRAVP